MNKTKEEQTKKLFLFSVRGYTEIHRKTNFSKEYSKSQRKEVQQKRGDFG